MSSSLAYRFAEMKMICRFKIVDGWNLKFVPILRAQARALGCKQAKDTPFFVKIFQSPQFLNFGKIRRIRHGSKLLLGLTYDLSFQIQAASYFPHS